MKRRRIALPSLESLPQVICRLCGVSKICGLFTPYELSGVNGQPRCRLCCGEVSASNRRKGQSQFMKKLSINSPHA